MVNSSKCIPHSSCFCIPQSWPLHIIPNKAYNLMVVSKHTFKSRTWTFPSGVYAVNLIWESNHSGSSIKSLTCPCWDFCLPFYLPFSCELLTLKEFQEQSFQCMQVHLQDNSDPVLATSLPQTENKNITFTYIRLCITYASLYDHLLWLFLVQLFNIGHWAQKVLSLLKNNQAPWRARLQKQGPHSTLELY